METIFIFKDVSVRLDKMSKLTYEQLFESAINTPEFTRKKDAKSIIDKTLKEHGFKPATVIRKQAKTDKSVESGKADGGRASKKRSGNSKSSKK